MADSFSRKVIVSLLFLFGTFACVSIIHAGNGISVSGEVTDIKGGAVADATVALDYNSEASRYNDIRRVTTDAQGRFGFDHCQRGPAAVLVTKEGFAPLEKKLTPRSGRNPMTFRLEPAATILGRVVDDKGHPQAGVAVSVSSWHDVRSLRFQTTTDVQGRFVWTDAPPDTVLFDFCTKEMMADREYPLTASRDEQQIVLYPKLVIRGSVVDEDTGKPIEKFEAFKGTRFEGQKDVDYDGYVERTIREGFYEFPSSEPALGNCVKIVANGYAPAISRDFTSHEGSQIYDFRLKKSKAVSGVVLLPDGKPAENALVALASDGPYSFHGGKISFDWVPSRQTDSEGRFSFPAGISYYNIIATHPRGFGRQSRTEIEKSGVIRLQPWGRIEGTAWNGQEPAKHEQISFRPHWYVAKRPARRRLSGLHSLCEDRRRRTLRDRAGLPRQGNHSPLERRPSRRE